MSSGGSTPPPPDYVKLAQMDAAAQQEMLRQQTIANRPEQQNVYGSLNWTKDPTTGQWTQTEQLAPWMQGLFNQAFDAQQQTTALQNQQRFDVGALMSQPGFGGQAYGNQGINAGQYQATNLGMGQYAAPGLGVGPYQQQKFGLGYFTPKTQMVGDYNSQYDPNSDEFSKMFTESLLARVRPQQQVDQKAMQTQLRLQGLQPGTEAYNRAYQNLLTSQGDVNAQAQLQGMLAGGQEGRARSTHAQEIYGTQLQSALQRQQQEQSVYGTRLQASLAKGQFGRDEYNTALQSALQRGQYGMDQYNTQLQSALQRGEFGMEQYKTLFDAERARTESDRAGQQQQWQQQMQKYLLPWEIAQQNESLIAGAEGPSLYEFRPSFQNFMGAGQGTAADMMGATQQGYADSVARANAKAAKRSQQGSLWGGIIGGVIGGVATMNPAGAAAGYAIGSGAGSAFSDMDLKSEIEDIPDEAAYKAMLLIQPHSFTWPSGKRASGLLAQEVQRYFPHLVHPAEQGYLKVDYEAFTALLLGAFRHLAKQQEN